MALNIVGVLLAAGAGRRFGGPKILAHDGAWLTHAAASLHLGGCSRVFVTTGAARPPMPIGCDELWVPQWREGVSASVRAAIHSVSAATSENGEPDILVLHTIDTPDIGAEVIRRVVNAVSGKSSLARAVFDGIPGHPVAIGRAHFAGLLATVHGDAGARHYLHQHHTMHVECGDLATGADVDTKGPA
ncbi:nucleotidyltransferase family protein [Hoyosella rhizosphaerae]|uniref:Molybdopterin-guanine dinucleotide biosynthesis protein MobA n=1 Tax=Hoyosella rhizosphaerae TaxID=1755582 RepID=A0A916U8I0_9ACTN|nr:nucleotidyltransferase family protein [Hoyosella rhizosphaerae]GGC63071.1 molybdopterin-guanine dinucleotide biosynthesis protein MobA [Hoyosella rhizosphaerae]